MWWILAHQGGWDEFLMFAVPVALGWWAIKAAEKRSRQRAEESEQADPSEGPGVSNVPAGSESPSSETE